MTDERIKELAAKCYDDINGLCYDRLVGLSNEFMEECDAKNIGLIEAAIREAERPQWQPIETAPKDVKADVWSVTSFWPKSGDRHCNCVRRGGEWIDSGGNLLEWRNNAGDSRKVTHWMPIPRPPESSLSPSRATEGS